MTSLTRWLLRAFADNWPGGLPESGDTNGPLFLEDRDDSRLVDVDTTTDPTTLTRQVPSQKFDLSTGNVLGVALTDYPQTPAGLGGKEYRAEPVLSVRIQGADKRQAGYIDNAESFESLVLTAVEVVQNIDNGTLMNAPVADFHVADPGEQRPDMNGWKDQYSWQFDVEPVGYRQI